MYDAMDFEGERLSKTIAAHFGNATVEFKTFEPERYSHVAEYHYLTLAAYIRLFATEFVEDSIKTLLYLDCDVIVCDDIEPLWNTDLSDHFIAAVPDFYPSAHHADLGLDDSDTYINSGVLLGVPFTA